MYVQRVVIPRVLRKKVLKEFHLGHPGISRMKSLMRSYTYWPKMDQDIEDLVRHCKGCQLAVKSPSVRTQPWPKTDIPRSCIHMDYTEPLNGYYYLVIIDSYSKWPEVFKYKHPTATNTITALNEVFSWLGVPNTIVSDDGTMFTGSEFKVYYDLLAVEHITRPMYNPRSNRQVERFVDTFKRALKKAKGFNTEEKNIQTFLMVYRITPNQNIKGNLSPAEIMYARKICSVFNRLLPNRKKNYTKIKTNYKSYKEGDKLFFRNYRAGKCFWKDGIVTRRMGRVIYIIQGSKFVCKRHINNQLRPLYIETMQNNEEIPMEVLYDTFQIKPCMNVRMPIEATTKQKMTDSSKCESTRTERRIVGKERGLNTYVLLLKERNTESKIRWRI